MAFWTPSCSLPLLVVWHNDSVIVKALNLLDVIKVNYRVDLSKLQSVDCRNNRWPLLSLFFSLPFPPPFTHFGFRKRDWERVILLFFLIPSMLPYFVPCLMSSHSFCWRLCFSFMSGPKVVKVYLWLKLLLRFLRQEDIYKASWPEELYLGEHVFHSGRSSFPDSCGLDS